MTQLERYALHEILGSLIILQDVVDDNIQLAVREMASALRHILDKYQEEE